ncbi:NINE protein [Argonema galeatum A003/A1]|nr:NINE protein [Argonema galeatum]MCL1467321.1 NINE protein [Argonema galeatum A003/A1]
MNDVGTSYLLWLACLLQLHGLHRLYNRKFATGLLWLCTFGLFGIGQVIDLVLIPGMVEEHNTKVRAKLGYSPTGVPINQAAVLRVVPPTRDQLMVKLVKAAAARGGKISVTQAVMDTGIGFADVEAVLKEMVKSGYVGIDNHPVSGVVMYDFLEI